MFLHLSEPIQQQQHASIKTNAIATNLILALACDRYHLHVPSSIPLTLLYIRTGFSLLARKSKRSSEIDEEAHSIASIFISNGMEYPSEGSRNYM